ncbi:MAG: AAA family ATPase [Devosia sp.]
MKHFPTFEGEIVETGDETYDAIVAPRDWIVTGVISHGLYVMAAAKKAGKSGLLFHLMMSVCTGVAPLTGEERAPGDCLFIDYENGQEVNKARQHEMYPGDNHPSFNRLMTVYNARRFPELMERLESWRTSVSNPTIVGIDIIRKAMPLTQSRLMAPDRDDQVLIPLHQWANHHRICVVMLVHQRLGPIDTDDIMGSISGSSAMSGTPDAGIVITRRGNMIELHATGRNLPADQHLAIVKEDGWYRLLGDIDKTAAASGHRAILDALREHGQMSRYDIRQWTGMNDNALGVALLRMKKKKQIVAHGAGKGTTYTAAGNFDIDGNGNHESAENAGLPTVTATVTTVTDTPSVTEDIVTGNGAVMDSVMVLSPSDKKENIPTVTELADISTTIPDIADRFLKWLIGYDGHRPVNHTKTLHNLRNNLDAGEVKEAKAWLIPSGYMTATDEGYDVTETGREAYRRAHTDPNQTSFLDLLT